MLLLPRSVVLPLCTVGVLALLLPLAMVALPISSDQPPSASQGAFAAKKKKKKRTDAEWEEVMKPLLEQLGQVESKQRSRQLFSPKDETTLLSLYEQFTLLFSEEPGHTELAAPLFRTALVLQGREHWLEAYDTFNLLAENFPQTPHGQRAKRYLVPLYPKVKDWLPPTETELTAATEPGKATTAKPAGGASPSKPAASKP